MKSTNIFVKIALVSVALCHTRDFEISASVVPSVIREINIFENIRSIDWNCTSNSTCTTQHSFCNEENKCQCPRSYVFNAAMTACLEAATAYGDECEETAQCVARLLIGGTCTDRKCNCAPGYHYLHGRCNKSSGLKEKCQNDDDCYVNADHEALSCKNGICLCSDGFYKRGNITCRREAKVIGAECTIDLDCTFDKNARCNKTSGCSLKSENTMYKIEDVMINHSTSSIREEQAILEENQFGKRCEANKDCSGLGPATCTGTGYCICEHGFAFNSQMRKCIPEIREKCQSTDAIEIDNSICRDGHWSCKGATVTSRSNLVCRKVTTKYNTSCLFDEQCYVFGPHSQCVNKRCLCTGNSHYVEDEMLCWINSGIGESCESEHDCYVKGFGSKLTCKESKCSCPVGTHVNWAATACINDTATLGSPCSSNVDCQPLELSKCLNGSCGCIDNYFELSGICVAGINAICEKNVDCKAKNSTCDLKICRCENGLVSPSPGQCIPVSPFGGECQYDIQCSANVKYARCILPKVAEPNEFISRSGTLNGTCNCDTGHHQRYKECYRTRVLDEKCYSRGECYVESGPDSVNCRKGVCSCNFKTTRINETFCKYNASPKNVFSSSLIFMIFFVVVLM